MDSQGSRVSELGDIAVWRPPDRVKNTRIAMEIRQTVSSNEWRQRPQRSRSVTPEIHTIIRAVGKAERGQWAVVSLTDAEKKRQRTIRGRITAAALQEGVDVKFEMRAGDLGIQRVA